jgi:hypothetical protein
MSSLEKMFPDWPEVDISNVLTKYGIEPYRNNFSIYYMKDDLTELPRPKPDHIIPSNGNGTIGTNNKCNYEHLKEVEIGNTSLRFDAVSVNINGEKKGVGIYMEVLRGGKGGKFYSRGTTFQKNPEEGLSIADFFLKL